MTVCCTVHVTHYNVMCTGDRYKHNKYNKYQFKREGKRFFYGNLICTYTLPEYISGIYVDDLCIICVKLNFESGCDFVSQLLIYWTVTRDDITGWNDT